MNKGKLSLSLVTSFIAAMAMTACGGKTSSDPKAVVTLKGYDGEEISVVTDDVYYDYLKSSSGISKFYDAMLEVLIRYEYSNTNTALWKEEEQPKRSYERIEAYCKNQIKQKKKEARDSGNYSEGWKKILDENGVENEKELLQKLIYDEEKSDVVDWYLKVNEESLLKEYIGLSQGVAASAYPYHIRHILANVSSGASEFYNGTISESEALKLYTVARSLKDGKQTFGEIAVTESGDTGSAVDSNTGTVLNGSLGIMDRSTSFVNEFKLGLYAFDTIYSGRDATATASAATGLGMKNTVLGTDKTVTERLTDIGLSYVPYEVFEKINEYKDTDKDDTGHQVNDGNSKYYPRNIYWNKYLNHHNVFVITNNSMEDTDDVFADAAGNLNPAQVDANITAAADGKCGFRYVENISKNANQLILTDEHARPIICVRSEHGIHFMIIEKSIYDNNLEAYYATYAPGDTEYDANADTFVNFINTTDVSEYKDRAKKIENAITSFDSTYDYRLYEYFLAKDTALKFNSSDDFDLNKAVKDYINSQREYNLWNAEKNLNDSWRSYIELIDIQNANRTAARLIPELCALKFKNGMTDAAFEKGGACYYVK